MSHLPPELSDPLLIAGESHEIFASYKSKVSLICKRKSKGAVYKRKGVGIKIARERIIGT